MGRLPILKQDDAEGFRWFTQAPAGHAERCKDCRRGRACSTWALIRQDWQDVAEEWKPQLAHLSTELVAESEPETDGQPASVISALPSRYTPLSALSDLPGMDIGMWGVDREIDASVEVVKKHEMPQITQGFLDGTKPDLGLGKLIERCEIYQQISALTPREQSWKPQPAGQMVVGRLIRPLAKRVDDPPFRLPLVEWLTPIERAKVQAERRCKRVLLAPLPGRGDSIQAQRRYGNPTGMRSEFPARVMPIFNDKPYRETVPLELRAGPCEVFHSKERLWMTPKGKIFWDRRCSFKVWLNGKVRYIMATTPIPVESKHALPLSQQMLVRFRAMEKEAERYMLASVPPLTLLVDWLHGDEYRQAILSAATTIAEEYTRECLALVGRRFTEQITELVKEKTFACVSGWQVTAEVYDAGSLANVRQCIEQAVQRSFETRADGLPTSWRLWSRNQQWDFLLRETGWTVSLACKQLGVGRNQVRSWLKNTLASRTTSEIESQMVERLREHFRSAQRIAA